MSCRQHNDLSPQVSKNVSRLKHWKVKMYYSLVSHIISQFLALCMNKYVKHPCPCDRCRPRGLNMRDLESPFPEICVQSSVLITVSWDPRSYPCPWDPCPDIRVPVIGVALEGSICVTLNRHFHEICVQSSVLISVSWIRVHIRVPGTPCPDIRVPVIGVALEGSICVTLNCHFLKSASNPVSSYPCPGIRVHIRVPGIRGPDIRVPVIGVALAGSICVTSNRHFLKSASNPVSSYPCPGIRVHIRVPGIRVLISVSL